MRAKIDAGLGIAITEGALQRTSGLVLIGVLMLGSLATVSAAQHQEQVRTLLDTVEIAVASRGYVPFGEPVLGALGGGETASHEVTFEGAGEYLLVAQCDEDCSDIDLSLLDADGEVVASDVELDDSPVLLFTATGTSAHELVVHMIECAVVPCFYGAAMFRQEGTSESGVRTETGDLAPGDETLQAGEYVDRFVASPEAGDALVLDLTSTAFDPYLLVRTPAGDLLQNDDFEGDRTRSLIVADPAQEGDYEVLVTSYAAAETGEYTLRIDHSGTPGELARTESGELVNSDRRLESGELVDVYEIPGTPGRNVRLEVSSSEFDTYLMLVGPDRDRHENDDADDAPSTSVIEATLAETGTYRVMVTSYAVGESGAYTLRIEDRGSGAEAPGRDVAPLRPGAPLAGRLEESDGRLEQGEYRDLYTVDGRAGDSVVVELTSADFDPYLGLVSPAGVVLENDDWEGRTDQSRIEEVLQETGRYRVVATSYARDATGGYVIELRHGRDRADPPAPARSGGRVLGVFVGISDYGGRASDLAYTAADADRVATALRRGAGMAADDHVILTDSAATVANTTAALRELGARAGPDDVFVFFFSGHGDRVDRGSVQRSDPDGLDETVELYDAPILDDELAEIFDTIGARVSLVMLDSCFSGGFSKDLIVAPGRMGMFSSEEDVTSSVAAKFRAGGYLAYFVADAIGERLADADGDQMLSAIELSQYLHERYRADVKSGGVSDFVRTGGPAVGYQHLVVDRGSVGPTTILFR